MELGANFDGNCKMIAEGDFDKVAGASSSTAKISVNPVPSDAETKIGGTPVK